jgi:hypothetical protein
MARKVITHEMYASIPELVEQGVSKAEIAERFGVKLASLVVRCSVKKISLRKGGRRPPAIVTMPLTIRGKVAKSLQDVARATGRENSERLVCDLLERIATDGLYQAVLDEDCKEQTQ